MNAWHSEQMLRSLFFHQKLHEWRLVALFDDLYALSGQAARWPWDLQHLGIDEEAWNKVIHRGIKPILVFAHPETLQQVPGSVAYYRMMAMVSQKSMQRIEHNVIALEEGRRLPSPSEALELSRRFNRIISVLIASDEILREEELWLWRGMSAGSQADGSWRNRKGKEAEIILWTWLTNVLRAHGWQQHGRGRWGKGDLVVEAASEPDIQVRREDEVLAAVEVKGGRDPAGVLERIGAAVKTLQRVKDTYPAATTVLVLRQDAVTEAAQREWHRQRAAINAVFFLEELASTPKPDTDAQKRFLQYLRLM